jgi:two-component system, NarL family, response regulator LiaR
MSDHQIQVFIVDSQAIIRKGIKALLNDSEGIHVVGEAASGECAIKLTGRLHPDIILIDPLLPELDGFEIIGKMLATHPEQRIIVLTGDFREFSMVRAIKAGVMGYVRKDSTTEELIQAIRSVYSGNPAFDLKTVWKLLHWDNGQDQPKIQEKVLSVREAEILRLMAQGKTDVEIAKELMVSEVTIRTHLSRVIKKLGFRNRVEAALYAIRSDLLPIGEIYQLDFEGFFPLNRRTAS